MTPSGEMETGLAPVIDEGCALVILGSFPGETSLAEQEYYAHPRNDFWPVMEAILGVHADAPYPDRLNGLLERGVGLWDVIHSCRRGGSSDSAIENVVLNDFREFLSRYPAVDSLALNGTMAARQMMQVVRSRDLPRDLRRIRLPSTSPANARYAREEKISAWKIIRGYLPDPSP